MSDDLTKDNRLSVAIIGMTGLPPRYGGWDKLVEFITYHLQNDFNFRVYCSAFLYPDKPKKYKQVSLKYIPLKATGIQSILYDLVSMIHALRKMDIY